MEDKARAENIHRLRSTAGHLNGIVRMLEADRSCLEVVRQIQAAQTALGCVNVSLLDEYLHTYMAAALPHNDGQEGERLLGEVTKIFRYFHKV